MFSLAGDILGATELKGPVTYRYKDLKSATKNFNDENKLGEGGFGDVYKVYLVYLNIFYFILLLRVHKETCMILSILE